MYFIEEARYIFELIWQKLLYKKYISTSRYSHIARVLFLFIKESI